MDKQLRNCHAPVHGRLYTEAVDIVKW